MTTGALRHFCVVHHTKRKASIVSLMPFSWTGENLNGSHNFAPVEPERRRNKSYGSLDITAGGPERTARFTFDESPSKPSGMHNPNRYQPEYIPPPKFSSVSFAPLDHDLLRAASRAGREMPKPPSRFARDNMQQRVQQHAQQQRASAAPVLINSASMPALQSQQHMQHQRPPLPPSHPPQPQPRSQTPTNDWTPLPADVEPHPVSAQNPPWERPPWLQEESYPAPAPRRTTTRERTWRENLKAAEDGRGPDPINVYILRKHGRRFVPGGLESRTFPHLSPGTTALNSTFAISNARLCTVLNGYPTIRTPIIPKY